MKNSFIPFMRPDHANVQFWEKFNAELIPNDKEQRYPSYKDAQVFKELAPSVFDFLKCSAKEKQYQEFIVRSLLCFNAGVPEEEYDDFYKGRVEKMIDAISSSDQPFNKIRKYLNRVTHPDRVKLPRINVSLFRGISSLLGDFFKDEYPFHREGGLLYFYLNTKGTREYFDKIKQDKLMSSINFTHWTQYVLFAGVALRRVHRLNQSIRNSFTKAADLFGMNIIFWVHCFCYQYGGVVSGDLDFSHLFNDFFDIMIESISITSPHWFVFFNNRLDFLFEFFLKIFVSIGFLLHHILAFLVCVEFFCIVMFVYVQYFLNSINPYITLWFYFKLLSELSDYRSWSHHYEAGLLLFSLIYMFNIVFSWNWYLASIAISFGDYFFDIGLINCLYISLPSIKLHDYFSEISFFGYYKINVPNVNLSMFFMDCATSFPPLLVSWCCFQMGLYGAVYCSEFVTPFFPSSFSFSNPFSNGLQFVFESLGVTTSHSSDFSKPASKGFPGTSSGSFPPVNTNTEDGYNTSGASLD